MSLRGTSVKAAVVALGEVLLAFSLSAIQVYAQDVPLPKPKPKPDTSSSSSKPTKATPATASLLIVPDEPCKVMVDDRDLGTLQPGHPKSIRVELGDHLIVATSTSGDTVWQNTVTVDKPFRMVIRTQIGAIIAEREAAAAKQAEEQREAEREAAAREVARRAEQQKLEATLSAYQGRWVYENRNVRLEMTMQMQDGGLVGTITQYHHRDSKNVGGECRTTSVVNPGYGSCIVAQANAAYNGVSMTCSQTYEQRSCDPVKTIPESTYTNQYELKTTMKTDGLVYISGRYQRCDGNCRAVSNPNAMDIGDSAAEIRANSQLYWGGNAYSRQ